MDEEIVVEPPEDDIEGVLPNVALGIAKMLENGTRYFGSAGSSLTHQISNPKYRDSGIKPELAKIGLEGERDTTYFLKKWMKDKPGVVLVDSVHIRGWGQEEIDEETGMIEGGDTDHVMLIGDEVILIDTKRWKSKRNYTVGDNGEALRTNKPFPGGNLNTTKAIHMWLNYLEAGANLTGIVHINTDEINVYRNKNWYTQSYRLVEKERFEELLNEKWKLISDWDKTHINSTLVSQVAVCAVKPYDNYTNVFNMDSLKEFK